MTNIENLISVADQEFISSGVAHSPYCSLNERLYLTHLSQTALGNEELLSGHNAIIVGKSRLPNAFALSIALPKGYLGYTTSSALSVSSNMAEAEGMILGSNVAGVRRAGRHFYSNLNGPVRLGLERDFVNTLGNNLRKLGLELPDEEHDSITTLMALIALNNLQVGEYFEANIRTFSAWFRAEYVKSARFYW